MKVKLSAPHPRYADIILSVVVEVDHDYELRREINWFGRKFRLPRITARRA